MLVKAKNFLSDVQAELKKVTWPARKDTISTTWVVVAIIILISFYLGICDFILAKLIRVIIR